MLEPGHGYDGLGSKGGRTLDQVLSARGVPRQQAGLDPGGKLVLAALAGDLDGESQAFPAVDAVHHGGTDGALVGSEFIRHSR